MIDYHEAVRTMHLGNVVQYIGTVNGNVFTDRGRCFAMQRGVIFLYENNQVVPRSEGNMVYDPDFRYAVLADKRVDPRGWPNKPKKYPEIKPMTGYSRIGLNNV